MDMYVDLSVLAFVRVPQLGRDRVAEIRKITRQFVLPAVIAKAATSLPFSHSAAAARPGRSHTCP